MPEPPLILVTNDDKMGSPGLHAAAEAVAGLGDLLLVAPATQQTAMSRAFVTNAGVGVVERVTLEVAGRAVPAYAVSGSPVMAVTHAVLELAERPIRLCVSGINYGENIGGAIGRSGTVGAAFEADVHAIVRDQVASVTPLAVTSAGVIAVACAQLTGLPADRWPALARVVVNASITKLITGQTGTHLLTFNDHAHLEGDRSLITYR